MCPPGAERRLIEPDMHFASTHSAQVSLAPARPRAEPAHVVLVTGGRSRHDLMRACIDGQAPGCRIEVIDSCFDAMARAGRMPAHLMVLDLTLDSLLVPALKQFLTRSAPQVALHVFDDSQDPTNPADGCRHSVTRLQADLQTFIDGRWNHDPLN